MCVYVKELHRSFLPGMKFDERDIVLFNEIEDMMRLQVFSNSLPFPLSVSNAYLHLLHMHAPIMLHLEKYICPKKLCSTFCLFVFFCH